MYVYCIYVFILYVFILYVFINTYCMHVNNTVCQPRKSSVFKYKKTSYIIFGNNKKTKQVNMNIKIDDVPVERQYETKFLGVILSSDLK